MNSVSLPMKKHKKATEQTTSRRKQGIQGYIFFKRILEDRRKNERYQYLDISKAYVRAGVCFPAMFDEAFRVRQTSFGCSLTSEMKPTCWFRFSRSFEY
jgi:hypothetical protein